MIIPFQTASQAGQQRRLPSFSDTNGIRMEWNDGSYLVGILDGTVVGATALSNGLCIVDLTDGMAVLAMLRQYLPEDVRAFVRKELLKAE